jgi:uncharacterized protein YcbX
MPTVARFNVTPVKGTALAHPGVVTLSASGVPENRRFFLLDADGALYSGPRHGPLVQVEAAEEDGALTCGFPDGTIAAGPVDSLGAAHLVDFYGRPVQAREVHGPWADAFSAYVGRELRLVRAEQDGDGADVLPLTIVSYASVDDLGRRGAYPGALDPRRFRITIELDGAEPFEEDTWDGREVAIGDAVIRLAGQIPRCVVTTQDPESGLHDWNTLKQIATLRGPMQDRSGVPFGMYAIVVAPATVPVGATVAPLDV